MSGTVRKALIGAGIAAVVAVGIVVWGVVGGDGGEEARLFASGTVEATQGHLGFQVAGRVREIRVEEGDPVRAGDTLALLDREEAVARREAAEARAREARAQLRELEEGFRREEVEQARAALAAARERLEDARRDRERTRTLFEGGAVSEEALDKATTAFEVARSEVRGAEERLGLLEEGPRRETVEAQRARLEGARAFLRVLDATLDNMVVVAPFGGIVTVRHREPGESAAPGSPILTVMNPDDRWVRIHVREDRIGAVSLGQPAAITSDTYEDRIYDGRVRFIASEAEFTPKNVQTTEERVKLVYAVKVKITGDPEQELKPGMPADVEIELDAGGPAGRGTGR